MQSGSGQGKAPWYVRWRFGLSPVIVGVLILVFVILTGDRYAWTLWLAVPILMIGLGYIFIIAAIESFWSIEQHIQDIKDGPENEESHERPPQR